MTGQALAPGVSLSHAHSGSGVVQLAGIRTLEPGAWCQHGLTPPGKNQVVTGQNIAPKPLLDNRLLSFVLSPAERPGNGPAIGLTFYPPKQQVLPIP